MNTRFKFRVWNGEKMSYCEFTNRIGHDEGGHQYLNCYIDKRIDSFKMLEIQQWTGLKDKNGKNIYEGDIIKCFTYEDWGDDKGAFFNKEVKFEEKKFGETNLAGFYLPENREVIGNIFENPNLI